MIDFNCAKCGETTEPRGPDHMGSDRLKHLEFIQNVITRMNTNSFQLKGLTVLLVSALLGLYATREEESLLLLGMLPTFIFWLLDAYYLSQERKYRALYNDAAGLSGDGVEVPLFSMNTAAYQDRRYSHGAAACSRTVYALYLPIILFLAAVWAWAVWG